MIVKSGFYDAHLISDGISLFCNAMLGFFSVAETYRGDFK